MSISNENLQNSSSLVEFKVKCKEEDGISDVVSNGISSTENLSEGKWCDEENVKFTIFMTLNKDVFKSK